LPATKPTGSIVLSSTKRFWRFVSCLCSQHIDVAYYNNITIPTSIVKPYAQGFQPNSLPSHRSYIKPKVNLSTLLRHHPRFTISIVPSHSGSYEEPSWIQIDKRQEKGQELLDTEDWTLQ